jgi:uncharacterized lipoprotein
MNRRSLMQFTGLASAAALLAGCSWNNKTYRQKIKVTVATPDGDKSGSAVSQIDVSVGYSLGAGEMAQANVKGEATVVDLGQGKYLFALLSEHTKVLAGVVFPNGADEKDGPREIPRGDVAGTANKYSVFPMLVTFTDINDPQSVKEVKPSDLAGAFGTGYALKSVTLEITDEKVTQGVVFKLLPWAAKMNGSIGKDMNLPYGHLLNQINDGSFSSELRKP